MGSEMTKELILEESPIRRSKLHELVSRKLEEMILSGELKSGDNLPSERDIMTAFKIGRPAVREALLSLQNRGLIATEAGRRARVTTPTVKSVFMTLDGVVGVMISKHEQLKNLFDARKFIEAAMARHAAIAVDEVQLGRLHAALQANHRAIGNRELFMRTDIEFHRILFLVDENPVFEAVHSALVKWLMERWASIRRDERTENLAYQGHLQIAKAIGRHDAEAAEHAMNKHLSSSWAIWAKQLSK